MSVQLFVPTFSIEEVLAEIRECLEKGWTGLGYKTVEMEKAWSEYTGLPNAHFLNSATSGLHLALNIFREADNWQDGDEVLTTPLTFVSTNHAILYERLRPVFVDVDQHLCLDPIDLEKKITQKTRAVIFVGLGGNTGQFAQIKAMCEKHGLKLILDAAHMAGTTIDGVTPSGDATVYSFQAVKNLPTADSGMICFEDKLFDEIARKKTWLGINKDTYSRSSDKGSYKWHYDVEYVGFKYHGNSIMAAIALVQLRHLDRDNAYRRQLCEWYDQGFRGSTIKPIPTASGCESSRHLYQIEVENRDKLMLALNGADIYPGVHYRDNRSYHMFNQNEDTCPNASRMSEKIISLPLHMRLSKSDVMDVVSQVKRYARD